MLKLLFNLRHQAISLTNPGAIVATDSKNYLVAKFNMLSDDWDMPLSVIFTNAKDSIAYTILVGQEDELEDNECYVPWEVLTTSGDVYVSVFCGSLHTTNTAVFHVVKSGYAEGEIPPPPTPTIYEQMLRMIEEIREAKQNKLTAGENITITENDVISAVAGIDEAKVLEILDNTLSGNLEATPSLLIDNVVNETYNPDGDLILYYIDSEDVRHNVFDFTPYLENYVSSAVVNQNGTITFTLDDGSTFTTTGSSVIGSDGYSPTIIIAPEYLRTRVDIIDVNGMQYFYINDGESVKSAVIDANGDLIITIKGKPTSGVRPTYPERVYNVGHVVGADGYSPTATVTQTQSGATVTITDKNGTTTANISNGTNGSDYILTAQDKSDIADLVLAELPTTQGVQYGNTGN